jgi:WD40 repeat protein/DNA-binding SARP family transcriptional activator
MLEVRLLGLFDIRVDGQKLDLTSHPARLLLIYLVLHSDVPVHRDKLASLIWPDSSEKRARNNLRHALWRLRKAFEEAAATEVESIKADDETLRFDPEGDSFIDVALLNQKMRSEASIEEIIDVLEVYAGDLLPGFYEDWIVLERDRLRAVFEAGIGTLLERLLAASRWAKVLEWGERWIALGGAPEPAYRALMIAQSQLNDFSSVSAIYQRCVNSLRQELGIEPSEETHDLYKRIMAGEKPVPAMARPEQHVLEQPVRGYELRELLGSGRFGAVYRAHQPVVGRDVAVKIILPQFADDPDFIRRFAVEAELVARLEHPHIVPLYDYWREPGGAFLVMRWLRGGSLQQALQRGPWHLAAAVQMVEQVAAALHVAHRQGIIHRDIKPANILLDNAGNAYLSDFGMATLVGPLEAREEPTLAADADEFPGSLGHSSPESIERGPVTAASDIYSLGVVVYELLTARHPFHGFHGQALLNKHLHQPIPAARALRPELPSAVEEVIQQATAKDPGERYADVLELAAALEEAMAVRPQPVPARADTEAVRNPYKGLRPFQEADAADFFGRNALVERLLDRMREDGAGSRFLALVGPSGSGKSSAIGAGLLPRLRRGAITGSEDWFIAQMVPGRHPLDELELALLRIAVSQPAGLMEQLRRDERGLLRAASLILPDEDSELLLIIDQFEELFALTVNTQESVGLLELLVAAVTEPRSQVRILISLRADFYDLPLMHIKFGRLMQARTEVVVPMDAEEMSQAIHEPAVRAGVQLEPELMTTMVTDVGEQPGALPLLQYVLTELFERQDDQRLTLAAYHEMDGVLGALGRRAEEIYQSLDRAEQDMTRQLFLRLVTLGEGVEDTRRRALRSELEALQPAAETDTGDSLSTTPLDSVLEVFGRYRLLTFDRDPSTRGPTIEVAHEALLRKWDRLRGWLNESRDDLRQERAVAGAAEDWEQHNRDESFLLRGARLEQVEEWRATSKLIKTPLEQEFISQSLYQRDKEQQAETERKERERRLERRSQIFLRGLVAVFALATLVSVGLVFLALDQRQSALDSAANAQNVALVEGSRAALANRDTGTAIALAWQAVALNPDSALAQAQLSEVAYAPGTVRILRGNKDIATWIAISPDDKTLLAGVDDGSVILWELATGQLLWEQQVQTQIGERWVQDVAFSPDGQVVAATYDDRIMLWQAATGQLIRQIDSSVNRQKITFNPTGDQFATTGSEEHSRLVVWDFASGKAIREFERGSYIEDLVYTPDGSTILIASRAGVLTLIDAQTGQVIREFQEYLGASAGALHYISLNPDGTRVIAASYDTDLLPVWEFETGKLLENYTYAGVFSSAFHPQDDTVLIGDFSVLRTIDLRTGTILRTNTGHSRGILNLAITSDGSRAVTTGVDETIRVWDLQGGQVVRRFTGARAGLGDVSLSPDGRTTLVGFADGTAALYDVETGEEIRRFVQDQTITTVTFSPDGRKALIGTGTPGGEEAESGHIILWDVETGDEIRRFEGQPYDVVAVDFSPDGRLAVSAGTGAVAILWDVETGAEVRRFEDYWVDSPWDIETYEDVAFSPDGQQIFASHASQVYESHRSGVIIGWDVESGEQIQQLVGHSAAAFSMMFSNDGQRLVSGGTDSQLLLWDIGTGNILRRFATHSGGLGQVRFSPDETLLLGGSLSGINSLWQVDTGEEIRRYGGGLVKSPNFTPDGRHAVVGYLDGAVELWRIDSTLEELLSWTRNNRYIPELTCEQRELYGIEPLCEQEP